MKTIRLRADALDTTVELNDSATAEKFFMAVPMEGRAARWGGSLRCALPLECFPENPTADVEPGTAAYWPAERAFCVFFSTPPAEPVNVIGTVRCTAEELADVPHAAVVRLTRS